MLLLIQAQHDLSHTLLCSRSPLSYAMLMNGVLAVMKMNEIQNIASVRLLSTDNIVMSRSTSLT